MSAMPDGLLTGAVDLHYHSAPSPFPRKLDPAVAALCAALALGACSDELPLTEIVLAIDSDNPAIKRIDIKIENFGDGELIEVPIDDLNDWPRGWTCVTFAATMKEE